MFAERFGIRIRPGLAGRKKTVPAEQGLTAGTRVASGTGWQRVSDLSVGDRVMTFDNGLQEIIAIERSMLWHAATAIPTAFRPLTVPVGALRNHEDITLLPEQGVLVESELVRDPMGDPFAVVPAQALEGLCGIHRAAAPRPELEQVRLRFARDEVIYVQGGVLAFCPGRHVPSYKSRSLSQALYMIMPGPQAREVLMLDTGLAERALLRTGRFETCAAGSCPVI